MQYCKIISTVFLIIICFSSSSINAKKKFWGVPHLLHMCVIFKFNGISSSQSKEIFQSCCKISFSSSIDRVKGPNGSKTKDIKLSKPLFDD